MARNIEIKARVEHIDKIRNKAAAISEQEPEVIKQNDLFFNCENGRIKLRKFPNDKAELIFYQRPDQPGPKNSFYVRTPVSSPKSMAQALTHAYGQAGRVQKKRTLFITNQIRIHIDEVKNLGNFLELEVVLAEDESSELGIKKANDLMSELGIKPSQLIEGAYIDLLTQKERS